MAKRPDDGCRYLFGPAFVCGLSLAAMLVWSIRFPERRLWPVGTLTVTNQLLIWVPTAMIFICVIVLGLIGWNDMGGPAAVRFDLGIPLIAVGNVVVWSGVSSIGVKATSGAASDLNTDGLYRWSRNPQYVADIAILAGLAILSGATVWAQVRHSYFAGRGAFQLGCNTGRQRRRD